MRQTLLAIFLIAVILAAGAVWFFYVRTPPPQESLPGLAQENERLTQYRQIKNLKLDLSILTDPLFRSLVKPALPPSSATSPEKSTQFGRPNPFAPL